MIYVKKIIEFRSKKIGLVTPLEFFTHFPIPDPKSTAPVFAIVFQINLN